MDFQFQSWERLSDDVTDGAADARVEIEGQAWMGRICGDTLWMRRASAAALEHNYALRARLEDACGYGYESGVIGGEVFGEQTRDILQRANIQGHLHRIWQLEDGVFAAWNAVSGWELYRNAGSRFNDLMTDAPFRFLAFPSAPSSKIYQVLQNSWSNPDSDLSFSVRWIKLGRLERDLLGVQTRVGTPQEFARTVSVLMRALVSQWPVGSESLMLNFKSSGDGGRFQLDTPGEFDVRGRALIRRVLQTYEPRRIADNATLPSALRVGAKRSHQRFAVGIIRPSQHEQLEAALELRAWLAAHWPDGVRHLSKIV